jgi:benzoyl-CoA reductase/2-hydroxyglutaryl-CoA dehydratase subunit BcrC/BadD/HgdB
MMNETVGKRYMPEVSRKEIDELKTTMKAASQKVMIENIERMKKADPHRPNAMNYFDEISNLFGKRQEEIQAEKNKGKKVIGYMCLFAPTELILAANAIPVRVNSGWYDTSKLGDRVVPVEVCPVIRSTIGAKMIELSPFMEQSDALISVLTCDGMTKLSEILGDSKTVWGMNVPRIKDSTQSLRFWNDEIKHMKTQIEHSQETKLLAKTSKKPSN